MVVSSQSAVFVSSVFSRVRVEKQQQQQRDDDNDVFEHETTADAVAADVLRQLPIFELLHDAGYRQNARPSRRNATAIGLGAVRGVVQSIRM